ncbi:glycoside hydrolase family 13 protein [Oceanithermus sp.]
MSVPAWVERAVFYQIFPDRFRRAGKPALPAPTGHFESWDSLPTVRGFKGGDLWGVAEKLDYLEQAGFSAIYLNPIFASSANHRYHTSDYLRVDPILGGDEALRNLLDQAHERGMRVILDGVFNHSGRGFFAFSHLLENGPASPYQDWYYVKGFPLRAYGGKPNYEAWWDNPELPKLRVETPQVREYLLHVAEHWIRFGADGWRLDVPEEIKDMSFWQEFRRRVKESNPEAYIVGEIWHEAPDWVQPGGPFDAVMNYPLGRGVLGFVGGERLDRELAARSGLGRLPELDGAGWLEWTGRVLESYPEEVRKVQLNLLGSHDTPRLITMLGGEAERAALALELLFTLPGAPSVYYGDEIGLPGGHDPDNRRTFPWNEEAWNHDIKSRVGKMARLREQYGELRGADWKKVWSEARRAAFSRGRLLVTVNASEEPWKLDLDCPNAGDMRGLLYGGRLSCAEGRWRGAELPAFSLEVWRPEGG